MRGEFQECGYECCIAMSHRRHRRYRHHLLTTAPPPPIDDRGKGPSMNDVHTKIMDLLIPLDAFHATSSVLISKPGNFSVRTSFMHDTNVEGVITDQARGCVSAYANVMIRKTAL